MSHIARAEMLMGQDRYDLAVRELHGALADEPDSAPAHVLMALCLSELNDEEFDEALAHAREAVRIAPDWHLTHYAHAIALHHSEQLDPAEEALREALRLDPLNPDYFALLADVFMQRRKWKEALALTEKGLEANPEHLTCTNLRAIALNRLGRKDEADAAIGEALARDPENSASHANMGWTALHASDPKKALHHFRESLRIDPNNEWAQHGMLEALKARYLVYRWILAYHFFMARFSEKSQFAILIGAYVLYRLIGALGAQYPQYQPFVAPVAVAYVSFAFLTWFAQPIFNSLLMLNPFGRMVLPPRMQRAALIWMGLIVLGAASFGAYWLTDEVGWMYAGGYVLLMTLPVNVTLGLTKATQRTKAGVYTTILAVIGVIAVVGLGFLGNPQAQIFLPLFLLGWMGFQWYANALILSGK